MAVDLYEGEVELKRVKESEIGWIVEQAIADRGNGPEIIEIPRRDHPVEEGQRWVGDPENDEWVLCGPKKKH